jgi:hypothetical protein
MYRTKKIFALTLIASLIVLSALNAAVMVSEQTTATVNIASTSGGTTDPAPGSYTYNDGDTVTIHPLPDQYVEFQEWIITSDAGSAVFSDLQLTFPVTAGTTYNVQAVFAPITAATGGSITSIDLTTAAIVVVLTSAGGTTSPSPGVYALKSASTLDLTATPSSGWEFSHWVISGPNLSHGGYPFTATPAENPYNVNHGYGARYSYQAVFIPVGGTVPTPVGQTPAPGGGSIGGISTNTAIIIALVVVIIVILIAFGVFAMKKKK